MAEVPVTIRGVIYPLGKGGRGGRTADDQPFAVQIVGTAYVTGLSVGGGPIVGPPTDELPPIDPAPPEILPDGMLKDPPPQGGWGFNREYGWGYFPSESDPGPKKR